MSYQPYSQRILTLNALPDKYEITNHFIIISKNRNLTVVLFVISWVLRNQTYDIYQYIATEYEYHVHLFSTRLNM